LPDASVLDYRVGLFCGDGELHHSAHGLAILLFSA
jgi:hypothetical protein